MSSSHPGPSARPPITPFRRSVIIARTPAPHSETFNENRSPLALRSATNRDSPSVSPKKRKETELGVSEDRYGNLGIKKGMRAEGGISRDVILRAGGTTRAIHLPGHPRLPSSSSFTSLTSTLRRVSSTIISPHSYSSLPERQLFNDLPGGLLMPHSGEVSDSSFFTISDSDEEGELDFRRWGREEDEDRVDEGDVSMSLIVELDNYSEDEAVGGSSLHKDIKAEDGLEGPDQDRITPASPASTVTSRQLSRTASTEEIANKIGQAGYVPDRIKAIETRQIYVPQPEQKPSPKKARRGQAFIIHHDADTVPIGSPSPTKPAKRPRKADEKTMDPAPFIDVISTQNSSESLTTLISLPPVPPPAVITPAVDLHLLVPNLTLKVDTVIQENTTLILENTAAKTERDSCWIKTREMSLYIASLENEKNVLLSRVKTAEIEVSELKVEVKSLEREREVTGSVLEKLERLVDGDLNDGVMKPEGDAEKMMRIGKAVVMMSQAGMLDEKHWSNEGNRSGWLKRKASFGLSDNEDVNIESPSKRPRV